MLWPVNNNVDNDSIIPKMEPVIPKVYEAFFDKRPTKVPVANVTSVTMTSGAVNRSKMVYLTLVGTFCRRLLNWCQPNSSLVFL